MGLRETRPAQGAARFACRLTLARPARRPLSWPGLPLRSMPKRKALPIHPPPPYGFFETHIQRLVALEACGFFLHAVDRIASRERGVGIREALEKAVFDTAANQMAQTFSEMIFKAWAPSPLPEIQKDIVNLFNARQIEYGKAHALTGETPYDRESALWLAAQNVAGAAEISLPDIRVEVIKSDLAQSLLIMDLANRIKKVKSYLV